MPLSLHRDRLRRAVWLPFCICAATFMQVANADTSNGLSLTVVAEMERPDGIRAARAAERSLLAGNSDGQRGLAAFRAALRSQWPLVRQLDVAAMSRYHVEVTRGWQVPAVPGELPGRIIGADSENAAFYLELQGPRLPASFDIVHRHLTFYARYEPATGSLDRVTATIRLEVFE